MADEVEEDATPVPPKTRSIIGEVLLIRAMAIGYGMGAFVMFIALLVINGTGLNLDLSIIQLVGSGILFVGILVGIISTWLTTIDIQNEKMPSPTSWMIMIAVFLSIVGIIMGMWADNRFMDTGEMSWIRLIFVGAVGMFFLSFIEVSHSSKNFTSIAKYAAEHNLAEFSVKPVISNYIIMSTLKFLLIALVSIAILLSDRVFKYIIGIINPQFAESIMLNSVYSLAIMILIYTYPLIIILLLLSWRTKQQEMEVVAAEHEAEFTELT